MQSEINGISCIYPDSVSKDEIAVQVMIEEQNWSAMGKEISRIEFSLDGDELVVKAYEKSPITRVRRITGYLSCMSNFNPGKRAEVQDRKPHDRRNN